MQTVETSPEPQTSEVRVRVPLTSADLPDVMIRKGMYQRDSTTGSMIGTGSWAAPGNRMSVTSARKKGK